MDEHKHYEICSSSRSLPIGSPRCICSKVDALVNNKNLPHALKILKSLNPDCTPHESVADVLIQIESNIALQAQLDAVNIGQQERIKEQEAAHTESQR